MLDSTTCKLRHIARRSAPAAIALVTQFALATPAQAQVVPDNGLSTADALAHDFGSAVALVHHQLAMPFRYRFGLVELIALVALALVIAWPLRLWVLIRVSRFLRTAPMEHRLALRTKALATVLITTVLMALAGHIAIAAVRSILILLPETDVLARTVRMAIGVTGLGMGIGRALRSAEDKTWRPLPLPEGLGVTIAFYPFAAGLVLGLTNIIDQAARVLHATETGWFVAQCVILLVETLLIARFLVLAGEARARALDHVPDAPGTKAPVIPAVFGITALVWAALAVGIGAFIFGETRFGMVVLQELLWAALVLTVTWLITSFIDALMAQLFDEDWAIGRFATAVVGVQRARMKQVALLGSALLSVLVWLFALGLVAAPLHGNHAAVMDQIQPDMLFSALQGLHLSPRTVGAALTVLVVGIVLTRMLRGWLENSFLPTTSLDIGVRTSLVTGLSYIGILVAMVLATQMMGLQLEKITLIASALSVGIGFGLQSIIQNFVSGVILLIERPVKVGDWVVVSGAEGTIRKIRVRATELVTVGGGTVIVPNSSFISSNVANRADSRMSERVDLVLIVGGVPTAALARDALRELIAGCTVLRDDPAPVITMTLIGKGEWTFAIKVYSRPGTSVSQGKSALLFWVCEQTEGKDLTITSPVPT